MNRVTEYGIEDAGTIDGHDPNAPADTSFCASVGDAASDFHANAHHGAGSTGTA